MSKFAVSSEGFAAGADAPRRRVRTPGKHIVLFSLAVTFMLGLSTTILHSSRMTLPSYQLPDFSAATSGPYYGPEQKFLTDLAPDATGRVAFLKLTAKVVAKDAAALAEVKQNEPLIQERIAFFLRELSPEDFDGSEAMARLKSEMLKRASLALTPGSAEDIIIEDLVIQ
jgi:flagellar FliL protein